MTDTPGNGEQRTLSDTQILDAIAAATSAGGKFTIENEYIRGKQPGEGQQGWRVHGCGLGGAPYSSLREALTEHLSSLVMLAHYDDWFERFVEPLTAVFGSQPKDGGT